MKEFYLNQLDKQQQKVYQIIKSGVESRRREFDVPLMDKETLSDIFYRLRLDVPEIFYLYVPLFFLPRFFLCEYEA